MHIHQDIKKLIIFLFSSCVLLLILLAASADASEPHSRHLVFQLEQEYIAENHLPRASWWQALSPQIDNLGSQVEIESLRLPAENLNSQIFNNIFRIKCNNDSELNSMLETVNSMEGVNWAEIPPLRYTCGDQRNGLPHRDSPPTDPYYSLQWSLHKVFANAAWDVTRGDSSVTIAIVDIGTDIDHNDLVHNRWINYPEANGIEGIDDDGNGFIDDVHGWDFFDADNDPRPRAADSHGTHVAGIAAAATDNAYGIAGAAWNCRYMSVRVGSGIRVEYGYEGVIYAAASGADVINLSWGGDTPSNIERITTEYAASQGAIIVAAGGNNENGKTTTVHYPAGYEHVLAVAAVDTSDLLASLSRRGSWMDIAAPGVRILSTIPGNNYGLLDGTSMASPLVAGAAALVKSVHPDWNADQIRLQLMLSADPIDNLNPRHADSMGVGRLNMFRAVSDELSGIIVEAVHVTEGEHADDDGVIDPNESVEIRFEIKNVLQRPISLSGSISSSETSYIQINPIPINFGMLNSGETFINQDQPFEASVLNAQSGRIITCQLNLSGDDGFKQTYSFGITVRPPYDDHDNGNIALTISSFGAIGYFDYRRDITPGQGLRYPKEGLTNLFHGSLMIGVGPDRVSDCAFGDSADVRFDFNSLSSQFLIETSEEGVQEGHARYNDDLSRRPLDIEVEQISISYPEPPDDDYIILRYNITNTGGSTLEDVHVGLFMDWDIVEAVNNVCFYDDNAHIGWMEHDGGGFPVFGTAMLDMNPGFHAAIDNFEAWSNGSWNRWSDRAKFALMQSGFSNAEGTDPSDYSQLIGSAPLTISAGGMVSVTFAVLAGDDEADLLDNLASANEKVNIIGFGKGNDPVIPDHMELISIYPQPFNGWVNVSLKLPETGILRWDVYNLAGRSVTSGRRYVSTAGAYTLPMNLGMLSSGKYFARTELKENEVFMPLILIK